MLDGDIQMEDKSGAIVSPVEGVAKDSSALVEIDGVTKSFGHMHMVYNAVVVLWWP